MSQSQILPSVGRNSEKAPSAQNKNLNRMKLLGIALLLALLIGAAGFAYVWFSGGNGQASVPTAAPILAIAENDSRSLFHIQPEESEVRFLIDEVLLGNPKTVIGTTQNVAGDLLIDWENPSNSLLGAVRVNLRTLETDNEFRNRALRGQILHSDQDEYEFAEFVPTALEGLPETIAIGDTVNFQLVGVLTLHGLSQEIRFDASLTAVSESRISGTASAEVAYSDFGLSIPEAPGVANVSETLRLEIDFVATSAMH
jgi:polyisoprenoid-binding protein YceI